MDRIKTRLIIAVTGRLSAAADTNAKADLIEELSDNLYQRYLDLTAAGVGEEEAYAKALEDLGDVDELLEYLRSLGPDGELPPQENAAFARGIDELLKGAEEIVRETISQTKDAVGQTKVIIRDVAEKLKEKYPNGFDGKFSFHFDDAPAPEADQAAAAEGGEAATAEGGRDWGFSMGYDRDRGGFYCEKGQSKPVNATALPSQDVKAIDVKLTNGDVRVTLVDDPQADVCLSGDTDQLELRLSENGVLSIRQGNTASSSFFFIRGLAGADIQLSLPRRYWDFIQVCTVNGDVRVDSGLEAGRLAVKTTSGDLDISRAVCAEILFKSASGDLEADSITASVQAETMSGDIELRGELSNLRVASISGDLTVSGSAENVKVATTSGDISVETAMPPKAMDLSSKSGDCRAAIPAGEGFTLSFKTVSGQLDTDFPLVGPMGAKSGEAIYLDGGERTYHISSVSGDMSLRQN